MHSRKSLNAQKTGAELQGAKEESQVGAEIKTIQQQQ
jgi:hypothetical protein